eukprot:726885-Rhodomonas_salina.1
MCSSGSDSSVFSLPPSLPLSLCFPSVRFSTLSFSLSLPSSPTLPLPLGGLGPVCREECPCEWAALEGGRVGTASSLQKFVGTEGEKPSIDGSSGKQAENAGTGEGPAQGEEARGERVEGEREAGTARIVGVASQAGDGGEEKRRGEAAGGEGRGEEVSVVPTAELKGGAAGEERGGASREGGERVGGGDSVGETGVDREVQCVVEDMLRRVVAMSTEEGGKGDEEGRSAGGGAQEAGGSG